MRVLLTSCPYRDTKPVNAYQYLKCRQIFKIESEHLYWRKTPAPLGSAERRLAHTTHVCAHSRGRDRRHEGDRWCGTHVFRNLRSA